MTWENVGLIALGLVLLGLGGDRVVAGGVRAAKALRVPTVVIGVVLLGFGTSLPELFTSIRGVLAGAPDLAVGNIVGSNIANLLLIAGAAAALTGARVTGRLITRDGLVLMIATGAFAWILYSNNLGPAVGGALLGGLAIFFGLALAGWTAGGGGDQEAEVLEIEDGARPNVGGALLVFGLGVVLTVAGAWTVVEGAVDLARGAGVPEAVIGATIVAVGTSLPELAATVAAALKGRTDMAIGNIFGSNLFNILCIGGVTGLFGAIDTPQTVFDLDIWAMIFATVFTLALAATCSKLTRAEGALLLLLYALFLGLSARNALA